MDFYKRVTLVCQHIPEGRAATYGQIALLCGKMCIIDSLYLDYLSALHYNL